MLLTPSKECHPENQQRSECTVCRPKYHFVIFEKKCKWMQQTGMVVIQQCNVIKFYD